MKQTLLCILLSVLSYPVLAKHRESIGCANLTLGKEVAKKIALIRAKADWVEHHNGQVVSGRETLLVEGDATQLAQTIKTESAGWVPSISTSHLKSSRRVKEIDGKPYLCIYLQAVK